MKSLFCYIIAFLWPKLYASSKDFPVGARLAGIANSAITLKDSWSLFHNQACMGFIEKGSVDVYHENRFLIPDLSFNGLVVNLPVKQGCFGVGIKNSGYKMYQESFVGLAFGRKFGNNLSLGMRLGMFHSRFSEPFNETNSLNAAIGFVYKINVKLSIGSNLSFPLSTQESTWRLNYTLPGITFGAGYQFSEKLIFAAKATTKHINKPAMSAGIEYKLFDFLFLRTGISNLPFCSSFGLGIKVPHLNIDFAGSHHPFLGLSPKISITWYPNV